MNEKKIIIDYRTKTRDAKHQINLLKIEINNNNHYVVIKSLSRLMNWQTNKNDQPKHYCHYCSHAFTRKDLLTKHYETGCMATHGQQFKLPKEGSYIEIEKYNTKLKCPFVVYGDFECITVNSNNGIKGTYQEHKPCGYMLNVVNSIDNTSQPFLYRGEDCLDHFVNKLREIKKDIFDKMNVNKPMDITDEQEAEFRKATVCSICNKNFKPEDTKVRDHCHFPGEYRGCAHEKCNLDYSFRYFKIPVFFII